MSFRGPLAVFYGAVLVLILAAVVVVPYATSSAAHNALVKSCHRGIADRRVAQDESEAALKANLIVARDPSQSKATRKARLAQAVASSRAIASRAHRLPPVLNCEKAFPAPKFAGFL